MLFHGVMSSSLLVSNIVGEVRGLAIPVMPLLIVSKIACRRIFMLSDPGVPRTFVVECKIADQMTLFDVI